MSARFAVDSTGECVDRGEVKPSITSFIPEIWSGRLVDELERASFLSHLFPPVPLTRRQRIKARIRRARIAVASWLAGFDVEAL